MNSTAAIIGKNLVLIGMVLATVLTFWNRYFTWHDLLLIQLAMGSVYVLLTIIELTNRSFRSSLPAERFEYYPGSFLMFRAIKIGMFLMFGIVLALVPSAIKVLYPVCLIIAFSELIGLVLKMYKRLCFISFGVDFVVISLEKFEKVSAKQTERVEFRHDIIYFVKKDGKTTEIKLFSLKERDVVLEKVKAWINNNQISVSEESLSRLNTKL